MQDIFYFIMPWKPSDILVAGPAGAVSRLDYLRGRTEATLLASFGPECRPQQDQNFLPELQAQLSRYLLGEQVEWRVAIDPVGGTGFQRSVWRELQKIPYGRTATYGQIAARLGKPGAMRAVGSANGANPIAILIPCHRVVAANGGLGGYGGGLDIKQILLQLEGVTL